MKWKNKVVPVLMVLAFGLSVAILDGCKKSEQEANSTQGHQYTCSMHPEVVKDKAGDCPKCGMKLVEKR